MKLTQRPRPLYRPRPADKTAKAMSRLRELAMPMPHDMKLLMERDAVLKLVLLPPEDVLTEALAVGRALQACAEHQRRNPGVQEGDCRKPPAPRGTSSPDRS